MSGPDVGREPRAAKLHGSGMDTTTQLLSMDDADLDATTGGIDYSQLAIPLVLLILQGNPTDPAPDADC
jgi:hypothetical protein